VGEGVLSTADVRAGDPAALFRDAGLTRDGAVLHLAAVSLADIADAAGTPTYVYNAEAIRARYRQLDSAFAAVPHRIHFAVKANGNLGVLRVLRDLGAGADIVSGGELARALAAGFDADQVVFSGVGKTVDELRTAARAGVGHVNVESLEELELLAHIAVEEGSVVRAGIRVNPDVTTDTHPYISTSSSSIKFGVPLDQVAAAAEVVRRTPALELTTIAMHLGSQLADAAPFAEGIAKLAELIRAIRASGIDTLRSIDIGGGLGIRYRDEPVLDPAAFASAIVPLVAPLGLTLELEPGRFLVGSAGVMLTTVLYRKASGGKTFVVVDAGMNDLVRPSHYNAHHAIVEVRRHDRRRSPVDVVGPVCETGDFLALDRELPDVSPGERLAVLGAGAYGFAMSSNYNARPRAAEVIVDDGRFWIARDRETVESLFAGERTEPDHA
jgi:diaminopimelate decarboxylase